MEVKTLTMPLGKLFCIRNLDIRLFSFGRKIVYCNIERKSDHASRNCLGVRTSFSTLRLVCHFSTFISAGEICSLREETGDAWMSPAQQFLYNRWMTIFWRWQWLNDHVFNWQNLRIRLVFKFVERRQLHFGWMEFFFFFFFYWIIHCHLQAGMSIEYWTG